MRANWKIWSFFIVVILTPVVVFGVVKWYEQMFNPLPVLGPKDHVVHDFNLKNQEGKAVNIDAWKGKIVVANFFFTHCPAICPKMVYQLKRVQAYSKKKIAIASFSVDPERDSVERLRHYAEQAGIKGNWMLLTGDKKQLYRFARKELFIVATDGDGGPEDFIHSESLVLIDRNKKIRGYYKGTDAKEVDRLIRDISKL
jgi:protein SCO1/2